MMVPSVAKWSFILLFFLLNVNYSCEVREDKRISRREISFSNEKCPGPCDCHILNNLPRVNCRGKELMSFPWKIPLITAELDLGNNQLKDLSQDIFSNNTHLARLWLDNNQLKGLPQDIFSKNTLLSDLQLNNNQLRNLPSGVFSNNTKLKNLRLDNNQLKGLPSDIFSKNTLLSKL
ncbi:leucine-rich repeat and transmembrane domain-containing protein 2 [Pocillopora verrucosa]|uniref:leucine-rich repeat and transmembrane domain-containing protein 2 n=1 Tax=Pocillopora verrucosa TaxID=203993 RepID=UPI003342C4FB